jgi:predicted TIM-barrel fold metal-dependent hydrolase
MITDVHVHYFHSTGSFSQEFLDEAAPARTGGHVSLDRAWSEYLDSRPPGTTSIVFGGKARRSGLWSDDREVAALVAADPSNSLLGFLAVDPTQKGWQDELRFGHRELGLKGVKVMPMYAGFDPRDTDFDYLWSYASENQLPIVAHTGTTFVANAVLDFARPALFDDVARRFPHLRLVLAHMGHPYEGECLAVIRKHAHVYADVSALHYRPFQFWHALMLAQDYGVTHKLLFGSDFPFTDVAQTETALRALTRVRIEGLPPLAVESVENIIHADAMEALGLQRGVIA